ncbi:MAG: Cyclic di-GMP phosphodiesterase response regulator RpfG [Syntrophorhabdus sp. PtaU1.Bin002]|nr:MAG: Cyclic di-GMP phosphodiesterase response regulator RpfG [Syntrophorhabdus sp. PtaU1.Bin002]
MNPTKEKLAGTFIRTLIPALTHAYQYTTSHQQTISSIGAAYSDLLKAIGPDHDLVLMIIDDRVVMHERPLEDALHVSRFVRFFRARGIEHLRILQGITLEELKSFIAMLAGSPGPFIDVQTFPHIQFSRVGIGHTLDEIAENENPGTHQFFENVHTQDLDLLVRVYRAARKNRRLPESEIRNIVNDIITAIKSESSVLLSFSPLRVLDEYTFTHSTNVCILNLAQSMALGIKDELLHDIGVAAMLHDTGKIFVPEEVLNKTGKLTDDEWEMIREHPQRGAEYLIDNSGIPPLAAVVAYEHHMQYDYSGYPKVSKDWRQNLCSQMTAVSDFFDALRTKRIYRDALETKVIADKMMDMAGTSLHPLLTKNFLLLMKKMDEEVGSSRTN